LGRDDTRHFALRFDEAEVVAIERDRRANAENARRRILSPAAPILLSSSGMSHMASYMRRVLFRPHQPIGNSSSSAAWVAKA
jgi:hypothetical protein